MPFLVRAEALANFANGLGKLPSELTVSGEGLLVETAETQGSFHNPENGKGEGRRLTWNRWHQFLFDQ